MADVPMPNPDAALVVAHRHQDEYEKLAAGRFTPTAQGATKDRENRFHHGAMAENNALLAIAGYLKSIDERLYYAQERGRL